jgi:hypothetical protein
MRISRYTLLSAVAGLVLSTCAPAMIAFPMQEVAAEGEEGDLTARSEAVQADFPTDAVDLTPPDLPAPIDEPADEDSVAPEPTPQQTPEIELDETVPATLPKIRVSSPDLDRATMEELTALEGVAHAAHLEIGEVTIEGETGEAEVSVAAVDPVAFRSLTPQVTADAVDVWYRIIEGDAAFTHDVGHRLELELGERIPAESTLLRVGAYASNGVPPVADVVVSEATAIELGLEGTPHALIAVEDGADTRAVANQVEQIVGVAPEVIDEPETRRAFLTGSDAKSAFEPFSYVSFGDGMIQIDPAWVRKNIVRAKVPVFRGEVVCHRLLIPQLRGALQEVVDRGLDHLIDPSQYGGCWVPRHILFNPNRALSMHAWGIAVDFNVKGNEYGNRNPQMDPRIVQIFKKWGFNWGGDWRTPDGMHFELGAVMESPQG